MQRLFGVMRRGTGSAAWAASACEAPGISFRDGVTLLVGGQPFWRGRCESPAGTEIAGQILEAYHREGTQLLDRLHGNFALAVLDAPAGRALLAVDRMGINRLAYAITPDAIVFSSSAEVVARELSTSPKLDPQALYSYLFFHVVPSPATVFAGVRKLPPATVLELADGRASEQRYWQPAFCSTGDGDFDALKSDLHAALREAVRCTAPDQGSGAFLSGGLDSSTVAGLLSEAQSGPAATFSIGFGFEGYDELQYARIANRHFGCAGHEYTIQADDIVTAFATIAKIYDEPFGNSSALPALYCASLASQHGVSHLLAGDGGDEMFAGNSRYAKQRRYEKYQALPALLRNGLIEPLLRCSSALARPDALRRARSYVSRARVTLPERLEIWNPLTQQPAIEVFEPAFLDSIDPSAAVSHMRNVFQAAPTQDVLSRMLCYDWRFTLADNDLRKVERTAEQFGVRVSYPMLHPDVVELAARVPTRLLMPGTELRDFYKRAMADFLPSEIINKRKHGFGLPFGLWLQQSASLRQLIMANLERLRDRGIVRGAFIDRVARLHGEQDAEYFGVLVWVLAMLEQWFQEHEVSP